MPRLPIRLACYGLNGHQVHRSPQLAGLAEVIGTVGIADPAGAPGKRYADLDALLADSAVELVSLCSPRRSDQARDAIRCLRAGKHVLAEKPCALSEADLDAILAAAAASGCRFREMAGSERTPHYAALRELIASGSIGAPFQVLVQKSYPWHADRPQDEAIDGGLLLQAGIHAARLAEAMAGSPLTAITADETVYGAPDGSRLTMAAAMLLRHASGYVSSAIINYGNTRTSGVWGNDTVRVFGPGGFAASERDGEALTVVATDRPVLTFAAKTGVEGHLRAFLRELHGEAVDLPSSVDEVRPLRLMLRARAQRERPPASAVSRAR